MEQMRTYLAVALAVLRNKPTHQGGEEYATHLAERFRASQLHWKEKYERAETEILHLKQQLVFNRETRINTDLCSEFAHFTQDVELPDSQSLFPTPPPSGTAETSQTANQSTVTTNAKISLAKHTEFLHNLISIQTASKALSVDNDLQTLTKQSLFHSLDLLKNHVGKTEISWNLQEKCIMSIVLVVDKCSIELADDVLERFANLCSTVIENIMSHKDYSYKVLEQQCKLLSTFGSCRQFTPTLIDLLCNTILSYSADLRNSVHNKHDIDPERYYNVCYIFKACQVCLTNATSDEMAQCREKRAREMLEDSLLHISEHFPLFAHAVWKLCALFG